MPLANDSIMLGRSIQLFGQLEHQNLLIISDLWPEEGGWRKFPEHKNLPLKSFLQFHFCSPRRYWRHLPINLSCLEGQYGSFDTLNIKISQLF